jgi:hypothetical protein
MVKTTTPKSPRERFVDDVVALHPLRLCPPSTRVCTSLLKPWGGDGCDASIRQARQRTGNGVHEINGKRNPSVPRGSRAVR